MTDFPGAKDRRHVLTVVLEEYFQVGAFRRIIHTKHWYRFDERAHANTLLTLDLLDEAAAKATFFVAGWVADNHAALMAEIASRGHELAIQGYQHRAIGELSVEGLREDLRRARAALEDAVGLAVHGFRIGRGRFMPSDAWALQVLAEEGFAYDSSLMPLGRAKSWPPERRALHRHHTPAGDIWEVPPSSWSWGGLCIPISGGNYIRQLPRQFVRRAIANWVKEFESPLVLYFHVWELDPEQPRITAANSLQKVRHYRNLHTMRERIDFFLTRYRFTSIAEFLDLPRTETARRYSGEARASVTRVHSSRVEITVVAPCFNEEGVLPYLAKTLARFSHDAAGQYEVHFVFVDDASTDGTWNELERRFGARHDCTLIRHPQNKGLAGATQTGIRHASTEVVCVIDSDCSYDPEALLQMVPLLTDGIDIVTASPYHRLGGVSNVPAWRLALSQVASWLYRRVLHNKLATYTSCFRVYRRSAVAGVSLKDERFLGIVELLARLDLAGAGIVEHPAVLHVRPLGHSKMTIVSTGLGHLSLVLRCALTRLMPRAMRNPIL